MLTKAGVQVTFQRITGDAPNTTIKSATITARVRKDAPDRYATAETGHSMYMVGAITQGDRIVIFVADDLANAGFPMPVLKNDKILLPDGTKLNIESVDPWARQLSGAIECSAAQVQ